MPRARLLIMSFSVLTSDPRVLRQIEMFKDDYDLVTVGYGDAPAGVAEHVEVPGHLDSLRPSFRHLMALYAARLYHRAYFGAGRTRFVLDRVAPGSVEVIIANDVNAVPVALALKPRLGVHADLHEYAPRQREDERWWRTLVGPFQGWMVRRYVTAADSVTTVSQGLAAQYATEYGVRAKVVPNASPYRADIEPSEVTSPVRLVHMGSAVRGRGIAEMVRAVIDASVEAPGRLTLDLYLKGGDASYHRELGELVAAHPASGVRICEPVPFAQIVPTLASYDLGLIIYPPTNFNIVHALPNKLFEYVQARLGVIVGPGIDMREMVESAGLGSAVEEATAERIKSALLAVDAEQIAAWKAAADARAESLGAEATSAPWREAVTAIVDAGAPSRR
ncbi:glycosyltransferase family 1 protein [Brachybacterium sp. FME24]|uniref:glycosyltransferase family 1 protein n=1 Tax=Brachybacterium sp. FME24 TaxID=2742605 RepID=UPI00186626E2|nr:glycosyltransferase family 1 protein [Brachybacterium sp. FME24]